MWNVANNEQDNPGEQVLSQRRDLLEQPLDFCESDVLPATLPIVSKHYRQTQWFGRLLFYRHWCLTNSVKALNVGYTWMKIFFSTISVVKLKLSYLFDDVVISDVNLSSCSSHCLLIQCILIFSSANLYLGSFFVVLLLNPLFLISACNSLPLYRKNGT